MHDCLSRPVFHGFGKRTHFLPLRAPMIWVIGQQVWHRRSLAIGHSDAIAEQEILQPNYHTPKIKSGHDMCRSHPLLLRILAVPGLRLYYFDKVQKEDTMAWTTPVLIEICIGLEINGYMPADGYVPPEF
jgi:coenzyme PQQ precursor peptide PqqA